MIRSQKPTASGELVQQRGHVESDVAIIGAGSAGCSAAIGLAKLGYAVTILEQEQHRRLLFGETLSGTAEHALREADVWDEFIRTQHLSWTRHVSAWGTSELSYLDLLFQSSGTGWFLNRATFDATMRARASAAGCSLHSSATILSCERQQSKWRLRVRRRLEEYFVQTRFLIDAAGRVGSKWIRPFPERTVTDCMIAAAFVFARNTSEHYTLVETVPQGWFYSASADGQFVLLFMTDPDLPQSLLDVAAEQLQEAPHTLKRLGEPLQNAVQRWTLAAGSGLRNCVATKNWVAVGDARMTLDPLCSSGILSALRSGCDAAKLIFRVDNGIHGAIHDYREQTMRTYAQYLRERRFYYGRERRWLNTPFWMRRSSQ
jgi:flavin-dependent dehydrogenase